MTLHSHSYIKWLKTLQKTASEITPISFAVKGTQALHFKAVINNVLHAQIFVKTGAGRAKI